MFSQSNHLRNRFCHLLEKIKNDDPRNVPFFSRFESIKDDILFKTNDGSYYDQWDLFAVAESNLFDLIDSLSECWSFARKRDASVDQKKGLLSWSVYPSEFRFRRKMDRRLGKLEKIFKNSTLKVLFPIHRWRDRITPPAIYDTIIASSIKNYLIHSRQFRYYEGFSAIAITGETVSSGFGRKVFDSLTEEFDIKIYVDAWIGKEYVVKQMLDAVGFNYDNKSTTQFDVAHLLMELRKRLQGNSYLIVFDFNWYVNLRLEETVVDELFRALPEGSGAAVIVTTLYEHHGVRVVGNRNRVLNLDYLLEDVSCLIFERALNEETTTQDDLQIAQKLKNYILENIIRKNPLSI